MRLSGATEVAVASLGAALVVFFAGATAAVAAGASTPTALWAAGGALTGGLLGLLAPQPAPKEVRDAAVGAKANALSRVAAGGGAPAPSTPALDAAAAGTPRSAVGALALVFVALLALAVVLAGGAITPPTSFGPQSLEHLIKTVVALASAAGTGLIGLMAPSPTTGGGEAK
jgi:hypothetical protein